jgi:hypothetical protein
LDPQDKLVTWEEWQAEMFKWQEEQRALDKEHDLSRRQMNERWMQLMKHKPEEPCQKP